ncbi:hypothetical protein M9Y10_029825 [Tritrichomonas musculus]|uniref:DUF3447 domain-containing protein n=1 Tax=Tritrichomonas musculus TaxID=1915356 RepID=A0ABR2KNE2_9EUKA
MLEENFDPDVLQKYLKIVELQDLLVYSNYENLSSNADLITAKLINQDFTPLDYSYCLYTIERYNSLHCKILAKLTSEMGKLLITKYNNPTILQELKYQILERIFLRINFESTPHILLYFLEKYGFYEGKDFLERIIELKRLFFSQPVFYLPFIVWFLPLFEAQYPEFYEETVKQLKSTVVNPKDTFFPFYNIKETAVTAKIPNPRDISKELYSRRSRDDFNDDYPTFSEVEIYGKDDAILLFLKDDDYWFFREDVLNYFRKDNWKMHSFLCENGYFPNSIEEVIANDDIDRFLELLKKSNINYDTNINYNIFFKSHVINKSNNLIEYAAFCSSVKIFKYLIDGLSEVEIMNLTQNRLVTTVPYLAVYSGCQEILKICEERGVNLDVCIFCASCFYKHEILSWLIENLNYSLESYSEIYICPLHQCASSNNLRGLLYLLYKGADINQTKGPNGIEIISPFSFGIEFNRYHTSTFLLKAKNFNKDDYKIDFIMTIALFNCDFNLFSVVFNAFNDGQIDFTSFCFRLRYADLKVFDFIYDQIDIQNIKHTLGRIFDEMVSRGGIELAILLFKKFSSEILKSDCYTLSCPSPRCLHAQIVNAFLENQDFLNDKKLVNCQMLYAIQNKRLDIIKLLLSKIDGADFNLSDLFRIFNLMDIFEVVGLSSTLFFKVYKYNLDEFYLIYFLILLF